MTLFNASLGRSLASSTTSRLLDFLYFEDYWRRVSRSRPKPHWSPRIAACPLASWPHFELPTFLFVALPRRRTLVSIAAMLPTVGFGNTHGGCSRPRHENLPTCQEPHERTHCWNAGRYGQAPLSHLLQQAFGHGPFTVGSPSHSHCECTHAPEGWSVPYYHVGYRHRRE